MLNIPMPKSHVYPPSSDSYLMLDAILKDLPSIPQHPIVVEVGSGTGVLIANYCHQLQKEGRSPSLAIAVDINFDACAYTQKVLADHGILCDVLNCNGLRSLRLQEIDVLIFNPPYVPTEPEEVTTCLRYFREKQEAFRVAFHEKKLRG